MLEKTHMQSAFARAGLHTEDVDLERAIARFLNVTNNDIDRLRQIVERSVAKVELPGEGRPGLAGNGHSIGADPGQTVEGEGGLTKRAHEGYRGVAPSSSPDRDGVGQMKCASDGLQTSAHPVREPDAAQLAADLRSANRSAVVVLRLFDCIKTSGGQPWGDVGEHELAGMRRDGKLAGAVDDWLGPRGPSQRFKPLRTLMTDHQFDVILTHVRGQNDAA